MWQKQVAEASGVGVFSRLVSQESLGIVCLPFCQGYIYIYIFYDRTAMASGCTWMVRTHPCARNQDSAPSVDSLEREAEAVGPTAHDRFMLCVCDFSFVRLLCVLVLYVSVLVRSHSDQSPKFVGPLRVSRKRQSQQSSPSLLSVPAAVVYQLAFCLWVGSS